MLKYRLSVEDDELDDYEEGTHVDDDMGDDVGASRGRNAIFMECFPIEVMLTRNA